MVLAVTCADNSADVVTPRPKASPETPVSCDSLAEGFGRLLAIESRYYS